MQRWMVDCGQVGGVTNVGYVRSTITSDGRTTSARRRGRHDVTLRQGRVEVSTKVSLLGYWDNFARKIFI